ncbi:hypothetical protein D3C86_2056120 [compost metagenome]
MEIGVSAKIRKVISDIIKVNLEITKSIFADLNFYHKREIVRKALLQKKFALMGCYNRERRYFKAFKLYIENFQYHLKKYNVTKYYLYSIYKKLK